MTIMGNKIQKIFIGSNQVRPHTWRPWANTVAYYPFTWDILDHSWNWKDLALNAWSYSLFTNIITIPSGSSLYWPLVTPEQTTWDRTINMRVINTSTSARNSFVYRWSRNPIASNWHMAWCDGENWNRPWVSLKPTTSTWYRNRPSSASVWAVFLMTWVKTWTTMKLYLNWAEVSSTTLWTDTWGWYTNTCTVLEAWTYWEIIIEDKVWTADEISKYYNNTRGKYQSFDTLITSWTYSITESVNYARYLGSHSINLPSAWVYRLVGTSAWWAKIEDYPQQSWWYWPSDPSKYVDSFDKILELPQTFHIYMYLPSRTTWSISREVYW